MPDDKLFSLNVRATVTIDFPLQLEARTSGLAKVEAIDRVRGYIKDIDRPMIDLDSLRELKIQVEDVREGT